jgi:mannosyltransferase OCH1-like enzyme
MDDQKCEQFINDHFSPEFVEMYRSLPYGVMKSDVWRIAIIYIYGGVYADLDTQCIKPIESWVRDYELVISYEPPTADGIANFTFAAIARHPALLICLHRLMDRYNDPNFLDKLKPTGIPIQNFGQLAFAMGIKEYINLNHDDDKVKLFSIADNAFTPILDERTIVHHQTASTFWDSNYASWRKQQMKDFGY